ncbi:MAG: amidase [SAR324 cluster bacterium]|nr:amidase [SAR324 cluster bacterium]
MSEAALYSRSATEIAAGVASGEFSAAEVLAAALGRIEAVNPAVNAIVTMNGNAIAEAEARDRRLRAGEPARPLEGVPFVVKDILHTKGIRTTFGSKILEHDVPSEDAITVERLKGAGAVLIGKTNTPEFAHDVNTANRIFGTTRNPWDLNVTAGGSSGGTGAALAAAMAPIGLGTDLGGSIRIPSSFCGTVGIRPSPGRVPFYPTDFAWDTLVAHVQGPMTRTVQDAGLMLSVLSGPDDRDPSSLPLQEGDYVRAAGEAGAIAGRRIAYSSDLNGLVPVDPEVARLTREAARRFETLGCTVEEDFFDVSGLRDIVNGTRGFGMVARYAERLEAHRELMTPPLINQVTNALKLDVRTVTGAERLRTRYWHRVRVFLEKYDYIVTPTCGAPPFRLDEPLPTEVGGVPVENFYDVFLNCYAFSVTGLPIVAVPCGFTSGGLPVGIQIVGRRLREDLVLQAAAAYATTCPQHFAQPSIDPATAKEILQELATPGMVMQPN